MIFTRHACERYRQFHMLDRPAATDDDARAVLERHASAAVKLGHRTHRGDPVWAIEALGIELVTKHEDDQDWCVTVLPPPRFRGLTPLQAEAVAASLEHAETEVAKVEQERAAAKATPKEHQGNLGAHLSNLGALKKQHIAAIAERDILAGALKTMRTQLAADRNLRNAKAALKLAVRHLRRTRDLEAIEVLGEIGAIDPGLVSDAFILGEAKPRRGEP